MLRNRLGKQMVNFITSASITALLLAVCRGQQQESCLPAYMPSNLSPAVWAFVNFGTAPLDMDTDITPEDPTDEGLYAWYNGFIGGVVSTEGLISSYTDEPGMIISKDIWDVPNNGEIQASAIFGFISQIDTGTITSPLGINEDPFYGCGFFGVVDVEDGWQFAIILTNNKVYAWYAHVSTPVSVAANFKLFSFLVPIGNRMPTDAPRKFSIVLNADRYSASYRIEGEEKLIVLNLGKPLDPRFLVSCGLGFNEGPAFPRHLQLVIGNVPLVDLVPGTPNTACQRSLFNECNQSPYNAYLTFCQYALIQNPETYNIQMNSTYTEWSLSYWGLAEDCHVINKPCQTPDLCCPTYWNHERCPCDNAEPPVCESSSSSSSAYCPWRKPCSRRRPLGHRCGGH